MPTQWKPLIDARPGDQLAEDLRGAAGEVLLKADAVLSERSLAMLGQRGIETVPVLVALDPDVLERETRRIDELLVQRFRHCAEDPLMNQVREVTRRVMLAHVGCEE